MKYHWLGTVSTYAVNMFFYMFKGNSYGTVDTTLTNPLHDYEGGFNFFSIQIFCFC